MNIDRSLRLPESEFHQVKHPKSLIVLHHTVGGSAKNTFAYWSSDPRRIGTAYLVERDGTIFEVFPPEDWCNHLGIKGGEEIEQRSIGIELASEGGLTAERGGDGLMYLHAFDGKTVLGKATELTWLKRVVYLETEWRGFRWFDAYDEPQVAATIELVLYLCTLFNVPKVMPSLAECRGPAQLQEWFGYRGVLHHAMLRKDKSDLHPLFPFERLQDALAGR